MGYSKQDMEDARQDYYLECLETQQDINEEDSNKRIKNIADTNNYRGRRIGSWYSDSLQYVKIVSLDMVMDKFEWQFSSSETQESTDALIETQQTLKNIFKNCESREKALIECYLKHDGSPGHMADELRCSPQYVNRIMGRLLKNLKKRLL